MIQHIFQHFAIVHIGGNEADNNLSGFVRCYKEKLYQINLTFLPEDFSHFTGFQYLKDLTLP